MTAESQLILEISDIRRVRFRCKKCESTISVPPGHWERLPYSCQNCGAEWLKAGSLEEKLFLQLSEMIETLLKVGNDRFAVYFEIPKPS